MIEAVAARVDGVVLNGDPRAFFEWPVADDIGEVKIAFDGVTDSDGVAVALAGVDLGAVAVATPAFTEFDGRPGSLPSAAAPVAHGGPSFHAHHHNLGGLNEG
jgi:hypothetical protein